MSKIETYAMPGAWEEVTGLLKGLTVRTRGNPMEVGPVVEDSIEQDPNGLDQHEPGAKLDAGKPRVALMEEGFANALLKLADLTTRGAELYSPMGWAQVEDGIQRYANAAGRHRLARLSGEERDTKTGQLHLVCEAWNVLAQLELTLREDL